MIGMALDYWKGLRLKLGSSSPKIYTGDVLGGRNDSYLYEDLGELLELESSTCSTFLSQLA